MAKELKPDLAINHERRCACLMLLDTSGSMAGERIDAVNAGLKTLVETLRTDEQASTRVDLGIMTFDSEVKLVRDFANPDKIELPVLTAQHETFMGAAIKRAIEAINARVQDYDDHGIPPYRPWLFVLTDGEPQGEPPEVVENAKRLLCSAQKEKRGPVVFGVGVGATNLERLGETFWPPARFGMLDPTKFKEMFKWISVSMSRITHSKEGAQAVALTQPDWLQVPL